MSRSYRYHNIVGLASGHHTSEKYDKRLVNKGVRHKSKIILNTVNDVESLSKSHFPIRDDIKDHWDFVKDGTLRISPTDTWLSDSIHFTKDGKMRK